MLVALEGFDAWKLQVAGMWSRLNDCPMPSQERLNQITWDMLAAGVEQFSGIIGDHLQAGVPRPDEAVIEVYLAMDARRP